MTKKLNVVMKDCRVKTIKKVSRFKVQRKQLPKNLDELDKKLLVEYEYEANQHLISDKLKECYDETTLKMIEKIAKEDYEKQTIKLPTLYNTDYAMQYLGLNI